MLTRLRPRPTYLRRLCPSGFRPSIMLPIALLLALTLGCPVEPNVAPLAMYAAQCIDLTCEFTDQSSDSDGSIASRSWDFGDGVTSSEQSVTHTYSAEGTYDVALTVTDNSGASETMQRQITVFPPNQDPTAAFTASCTDLGCDFSNTSTDSDGAVAAWAWDFGDGNTSTAQNPTHSYGSGGTYTVALTVTDDDGATNATQQPVTVTEPNQDPVAAFSFSCTDLACDFTDQSTDGDGNVASWSWDFGDGNAADTQNPTHTYASGGTYTVELTATDDDGATNAVQQQVMVTPANQNPAAAFSLTCTDLDCSFTDQSSDSDGTITSWSWRFGDGDSSASQSPAHSYAAAGSYTVQLTVTDNDGATGITQQQATVTAPNQDPVAAFSFSCTTLDCNFTDASTDSDGTIASWNWDFGDGNSSTAQSPSHTYAAGNTYTAQLTVTDDDGGTNTTQQQVTVTALNQDPTAAFSFSCTDLDCDFTDQSTDLDGTVVAWSWNFGDANTSTAQDPSHSYAAAGTYTVALTATDDDGATDATQQQVTVVASCTLTTPGDADGDRLPDCVETNTMVYVGQLNTGTDPNNADTDGDAISDGDEVLGTLQALDLPAMGVSPLRKDMLLEYDWFDDALDCAAHSHRPTAAALTMVTNAFGNAPVLNPDGSSGINFIHDYGQGGVFTGGNFISDADGVLVSGVNGTEFKNHKNANFAANRNGYFHYTLLPHRYNTTSSSSGQAEYPGDDMIVSLYCANSDRNVAHTIVHELGHNLLLHHGGFEGTNYKPNYNSVMNYKYQFPGIDNNCTPPGNGVLDYSIGTRITLDENNLDETQGVCGNPPGPAWDWNNDGDATDVGLVFDINNTDGRFGVLQDFDDWAALVFTGLSDFDGAMAVRAEPEIVSCTNVPPGEGG